MNNLDTLLAQVKNGAITVGEALQFLPEYMRQSVINNIRSGALTPTEALEAQTKYFNQAGPKQGPNPMQGPSSPSQFVGPPGPNQAYGPFQPGQGFNPSQGPSQTYGPPELQGPPKPSSAYGPPSRAQAYGPFLEGKSGLPNVSLPSASDVASGLAGFAGKAMTRLNPYVAMGSKLLESKPLNVGEEALLQEIRNRAGAGQAGLTSQEPQAQTREAPFRDPMYPGRDPNQQAYTEANRRDVNYPGREPYGQSSLGASRRDVEYPGRDPNQAAYEKAISAAPSAGARATRSPLPSAASTPTQGGGMTYYLDRGNGSPLVPMGTALPKNMNQGEQPGGGYIFGVNTPAPTNAVARTMQRGLGIKQPEAAKTEPVDPLTRKAYAPASETKSEPVVKDMDYGDRMPLLAAKKDFDMPQGEKRGGYIRGPRMAAGGTPCHSGIINMAVGGRTDHIPMNVMEGSYVLPADIVSGLGEGNTMAGSKILDQMMKTGPAGVALPKFRASPRFPEPPKPMAARGGMMSQPAPSRPVPIIAAGGEYVVPPDAVRDLGKGDLSAGHDYLDNFVKYVRGHLVKTLSKLPGPKKD
jgi:hypothetical protein